MIHKKTIIENIDGRIEALNQQNNLAINSRKWGLSSNIEYAIDELESRKKFILSIPDLEQEDTFENWFIKNQFQREFKNNSNCETWISPSYNGIRHMEDVKQLYLDEKSKELMTKKEA